MDNADTLAVFSAAAPAAGDGANKRHIAPRRRVGAAGLRVREDPVVSQREPPRSPSLAVVSPLVEDPGNAAAGADVRSSGIGIRSTAGEIHRRPSSQEGRLRRPVPDPRALQRYAAERVHLPHPHRAFCPDTRPD